MKETSIRHAFLHGEGNVGSEGENMNKTDLETRFALDLSIYKGGLALSKEASILIFPNTNIHNSIILMSYCNKSYFVSEAEVEMSLPNFFEYSRVVELF